MKTKIILTSLFFFIVINLACVSAADNGTSDNNELIKDQKYQNVEINEKTLWGSSLASLGMQIEIFSDDSKYELEKDYAYDSHTDNGKIRQGLKINKDNFVIDGKGHTIDGGNKARIFSVTGKNVTIKNLNIINANSKNGANPDNGAAIDFQTPGSVDNCTFTKCSTRCHGALFLAKGGNVTNSAFINNRAGEYGAGIYTEGGVVDNCKFIENSVGDVVCGAVCARGNVIVNNSAFIKNVGGGSGAITGTGNLTVENCNFTENFAFIPGVLADITLITKETDLHSVPWDIIENSTLTINNLFYNNFESATRIIEILDNRCSVEGGW